MNAPSGILSGIVINHGFAGAGGDGRAITVVAGQLMDDSVDGCLASCVTAVVDGNGDPLWGLYGHSNIIGRNDDVDILPSCISAGAASLCHERRDNY